MGDVVLVWSTKLFNVIQEKGRFLLMGCGVVGLIFKNRYKFNIAKIIMQSNLQAHQEVIGMGGREVVMANGKYFSKPIWFHTREIDYLRSFLV